MSGQVEAPIIYTSGLHIGESADDVLTELAYRAVITNPEIHIALAQRVLHGIKGVGVEAFGRIPAPEDEQYRLSPDHGLFLLKGPHDRGLDICDGTIEAIARLCAAISMTRSENIDPTPFPLLDRSMALLVPGGSSNNLLLHEEKCPIFGVTPDRQGKSRRPDWP